MPLPYRQVLDQFDRAKAFNPSLTMPDFVKSMNASAGREEYNAGLDTNWFRELSTEVDRQLQGSVFGQVGEQVGRNIGKPLGYEEQLGEIGKSLPRTALETASAFVPVAGPFIAGGLMGAHTYADTGSPGAGAVATAAGIALPFASEGAGQFAANLGGGKLAQFGASQVAQNATQLGSMAVQNKITGNDFSWEDYAINQLPWTAFDAVTHAVRPAKVAKGRTWTETYQTDAGEQTVTGDEKVHAAFGGGVEKKAAPPVPYVVPKGDEAVAASVKAGLENWKRVNSDPNSTPEQKAAAFKMAQTTAVEPEAFAALKEDAVAPTPLPLPPILSNYAEIMPSGDWRVIVDGKTLWLRGAEQPVHDTVTDKWKFDKYSSWVDARNQLDPNRKNTPRPPDGQMELQQREAGVEPTKLAPDVPTPDPILNEADVAGLGELVGPAKADFIAAQQKFRLVDTLPKSDNPLMDYFQGKIQTDTNGRVVRLGSSDVAMNGQMFLERFRKISGLPKVVVDALMEQIPEAFSYTAQGHGVKAQLLVDVNAVMQKVREGGVVETRFLDARKSKSLTEQAATRAQIEHELDTIDPNWRQYPTENDQNPEIVRRLDRLAALEPGNDAVDYAGDTTESATARFSSVNPWTPAQLRGEVEIAPGHKIVQAGDLVGQVPLGSEWRTVEAEVKQLEAKTDRTGSENTRLQDLKDALAEKNPKDIAPKFESGHYPSDAGRNQLFFLRFAIHEYAPGAKLPNGEIASKTTKVMEVWELQADHQPKKTSDGKHWVTFDGTKFDINDHEGALKHTEEKFTPLTSDFESLALRTAVQHALKNEVDAIVLSDGESAMMTEGHDKGLSLPIKTKEEAKHILDGYVEKYGKEGVSALIEPDHIYFYGEGLDPKLHAELVAQGARPKQAPGMTAAYDSRLLQGLEKLTGEKGVGVDMGRHQNAHEYGTGHPEELAVPNKELPKKLVGSPVFKNPDGQPKTQNTGRLFSLDKLRGGLSLDDTLSLKEAVARHEQAQQKEAAARQRLQTVPTKAEEWLSSVPQDEHVKTFLSQEVSSGSTETQALESARLAMAGDEIFEALGEQKKSVEKAQDLSGQTRENEIVHGQTVLQDVVSRAETNIQAAQVRDVILNAGKSGAVDQADFTDNLMVVLSRWEKSGASLETLEAKIKQTVNTASKKQVSGAIQLEGTPTFDTEQEAYEHLLDPINKLDASRYEVNKRRNKWFIGERHGELTQEVSLDQPTGETTTFGDTQAGHDEAETNFVDPDEALVHNFENLTKDSTEQRLPVVEHLLEDNPLGTKTGTKLQQFQVYAKVLQEGGASDTLLARVNAKLRAAKVKEFADAADMNSRMGEVAQMVDAYDNRYFDPTLASAPIYLPEDLELHKTLPRDAAGLTEWASNVPTLESFFRKYAKILSGFVSELNNVEVRLPGDSKHDPSDNYFVDAFQPYINMRALPIVEKQREYALTWLHELTHHIARDMKRRGDPRAVEFHDALTDIRNELKKSGQLSKNVRKLISIAERDGHLERIQKGDFVGITAEWRKVLGSEFDKNWKLVYSLIDNDEMLSGIFSNPDMVGLAMSTKMQKGGFVGHVLNFFSSIWNKMIGGGIETDTALAHILGSYDNYLTGGLTRKTYNGADFLATAARKAGTVPEAMASRLQGLDRTYARGTLEASFAAWNREGQAGLHAATSAPWKPLLDVETLNDAARTKDSVMNLLAEDVPVTQELFNRLRQDHKITKDLLDAVKSGRVPGSIPPKLEANLQNSAAVLNSLRVALKKQTNAIERWSNLQHFTPEGAQDMWMDAVEGRKFLSPSDPVPEEDYAHDLVGLESLVADPVIAQAGPKVTDVRRKTALVGPQMSKALKTFGFTPHVARLHPATAPVISRLFGIQGDALAMHTRLLNTYNSKNAQVNDGVMHVHERMNKDSRLLSAYSYLRRAVNIGAGKMDQNDPVFKGAIKEFRLSPDDIQTIMTEYTAATNQHDQWINKELAGGLAEYNEASVALTIGSNEPGMLPDSARKLSERMHQALAAGQKPETAPVAASILQQVATQMQPETFQKALTQATKLIDLTNTHLECMRAHPDYVSETRFKDYHLRMVGPDKAPYRKDFNTEAGARKRMEELLREGYTLLDIIPPTDHTSPHASPEVFNAISELDIQAANIAEAALEGAPPEHVEAISQLVNRGNVLTAANESWTPQPNVQRKFIGGRGELNMIEQQQEFMMRGPEWLRHKLTRVTTALDMLHPEVAGNREIRDYVQQHVQNYLTKDNPYVRKATEILYHWRLAANFGNMLLESVQTLTTGMQSLISETGSIGDAYKFWGRAVKEIISQVKNKKWSNPDIDWFMHHTYERGDGGILTQHTFIDPDGTTVLRASGNMWQKGVQKLRSFSTGAQRYNDVVGMLSAYFVAQEKGLAGEAAYSFARDVKNRGLFTGGKAQRGVGLFSIKTRAVPQMMNALQTYTTGWFSQMAMDAKAGWGKTGMSAAESLAARKAFVYGFAAQAALAGALGLPGVGQGIALMQQMTGYDVKGQLRAKLGSLFHEDEETGGLLTTLALHGLPASVTPIDPSNRAMVSFPFIGVDPYKGFSIGNLFGAVGSTLEDYIKALSAQMKGDRTAWQKLLPTVARGPAQILQDGATIRDKSGVPLQRMGAAETVFSLFGIAPKTVQAKRDASDALYKLNQAEDHRRAGVIAQIAELVQSGNTTQAQQALLQESQKQGVQPSALLRQVAGRAEKVQFGHDWRRELSPGVQMPFVARAPSNETQRLAYRFNLEMAMGGAPKVSQREVAGATALDSLLDSNPYLSRSQAQRGLKQLRGVPSGISPLDLMEYQ